MHISDARGINGEGLQIGEGTIDFDAFFSEVADLEFSWVPEIWSGHLHAGKGIYESLLRLEPFGAAL
jgi:N-acetylneuraminate synthase